MDNKINLSDFLKGETLIIEYKDDSYEDFSDFKIYESAVAMANSAGGRIFVGVTNKGKVKGSKRIKTQYWKNPQVVEAIIMQNTHIINLFLFVYHLCVTLLHLCFMVKITAMCHMDMIYKITVSYRNLRDLFGLDFVLLACVTS